MRSKSYVRAAILAGALFFVAPFARAEPSLADRESARALMDEGDKKRDANDLKGALAAYHQADELMHVPTTGLELARTQVALKQLLQARETLGQVLRLPMKAPQPAPFVAARQAAEALNAELGGRIPSIQIVLTNVEPGQTAQVIVDDEPIPPAAVSAPRKVNPGMHIVTVRLGAIEQKQDVDVMEKDAKTVTFDLKDTASSVPSTATTAPPVEESSSGTGSKVLVYGGFGLAIVGIGVGTVTGLMNLSQTSDLEQKCPGGVCPTEKAGDLDSTKSLGNIATAAFIVGGVGVVGGVIGLLTSGGSSKPVKKAPPPESDGFSSRRAPSVFAPENVRATIGPSYVGLTGSF